MSNSCFNFLEFNLSKKEFVFNSKEECQIWSRTAQGDNHDTNSHLHYNAAIKVDFEKVE